MKRFLNLKYILLAIIVLPGALILQSCANDPNEFGLEYILSDTLGTKVLNSNKDSMSITCNMFRKYVNTYSSLYFTVGKYQDFESKALLRTIGLPDNWDSATVLSAQIKINYNRYAYRDTLGAISFGIYPLTKRYEFSSITVDSFSNSSIGTTMLGSYSGSPTDTNMIVIPFDNQTAQNWLNYSADTTYPQKNFGIIFVPNGGSTTIKGFGTQFKPSTIISNLVPKLVLVAVKGTDTLRQSYDLETVSLNTNAGLPSLPDRFVLQNGISYNTILNFDISKIPPNVIINQAYLRLTLDEQNSYVNPGTNKKLVMNLVTDSAAKSIDVSYAYITALTDSVTHTVTVTPAFFRWNNGSATNYGIMIRNAYDVLNLDRFYFYGPTVQDTSKRPLLIIRYTPRD